MKTDNDEAAQFRKECERVQPLLNLLSWTLQFKTTKATPEINHEAETAFDCETRHAMVTYNVGVEDALHPLDVALHEMLHLFLADPILAAIEAGRRVEREHPEKTDDEKNSIAEADSILGRVEHGAIEVLLKIIPRKAK